MRRLLILIQLWLASSAARIIVGDDNDEQKPVIVYDGGSTQTQSDKTSPVPSSANINDLIEAEGSAPESDDAESGSGSDAQTTESPTSAPVPSASEPPETAPSVTDGPTTEITLVFQTVLTTGAIQPSAEDSTTVSSAQSSVNSTVSECSTSVETASYSSELSTDSKHGELGTDSVTGMHTESPTEAARATFETNDPAATTTIRSESYTTAAPASPESTSQTSRPSPSESSTRSTSVTLGETTGTTMKTYATVSKSTTKAPAKTTLGPDEIIVYLPSNRTDQTPADPNQRNNQGRRVAPSRTVVVLRCVPAYVASRKQYDGYLERTAAAAGLKKKTFNNIRKTFRKFAKDRASIRNGPSKVQEADRLQTYQRIKRHSLSHCRPSERQNVLLFFQKLEENHNNSMQATPKVAEKLTSPLTSETQERLMSFLESRRALTVDGTIANRQEWPQVRRKAFQTVIPSNETAAADVFFRKLESRRGKYRQLICKQAVGKFATQTSKQRLHSGLLQLYRRTNLPSANFETFMKHAKAKAPRYQSIVEENIDVVNRTIKLIELYARIKVLTYNSTPSNERNALLTFFADAERYVISTYGSWLLDNAQSAVSLKWSVYRYALDLGEVARFHFNNSEQLQLNRLLMSEDTCVKRMRLPLSSSELGDEMLGFNCYWNHVTSGIAKTFSYRADLTWFLENLRKLVFFRNNFKNFLT